MARNARIRRLRPHVLKRDGYRCVYCGWKPERLVDLVFLVMDHVVPRARGGPDTIANLVTACCDCNSRKGTKTVDEFVAARGAA